MIVTTTGVLQIELELPGKRALITGASRGLGKAIAEALAAEGCDLILHARDAVRLRALADALRGQHVVAISCLAGDLSKPKDQMAWSHLPGPRTSWSTMPGRTRLAKSTN